MEEGNFHCKYYLRGKKVSKMNKLMPVWGVFQNVLHLGTKQNWSIILSAAFCLTMANQNALEPQYSIMTTSFTALYSITVLNSSCFSLVCDIQLSWTLRVLQKKPTTKISVALSVHSVVITYLKEKQRNKKKSWRKGTNLLGRKNLCILPQN